MATINKHERNNWYVPVWCGDKQNLNQFNFDGVP